MKHIIIKFVVLLLTLQQYIFFRVIMLIQDKPSGLPDKDLAAKMQDLEPIQRASIINKLKSKGCLDIIKRRGVLIYRLRDSKYAKCANSEEKMIYEIIEQSGNKGISARQIKSKSNMMQMQLGQILKQLGTKKLIKVHKIKAYKTVFLLYDTVPDESLMGGTFDQGNDIDKEFADLIREQCYQFLKQKSEKIDACEVGPLAKWKMSYTSSREVLKYISDLGISKVINFDILRIIL